MDEIEGEKKCRRCGETKPLSSFARQPDKRDGHSSHCKTCKKAYYRGYYEANKEEILAKNHEYIQSHPESQKAAYRRYNNLHKDERAAKRHTPEQRAAREITNARHRKRHPLRRRQIHMRYHAEHRYGAYTERVDYEAILAREGLICFLCGKEVAPKDLQFDHTVPLALNGTHTTDNIHVVHAVCNRQKRDKLIDVKRRGVPGSRRRAAKAYQPPSLDA